MFPMTLWDRLVPQAVLTLNLLCQEKADPKMSASEFVHGKMDYNKMPLAPLGCAEQMHESTNRQRRGMHTHSMDGTWAHLPSIIGATTSSALKQGWRESLTLFSSSIGISRNQW